MFKKEVIKRLSTGGASVLLEKTDDGKLMFVIKKINHSNPSKSSNDVGSVIYYNFAFVANPDELSKFCSLVIYVLTAFGKLKSHFLNIIELKDGEMSYDINIDMLKKLCKDAETHSLRNVDDIIADAEMPLDFSCNIFYQLIHDLHSQNVDHQFMLAVLDSNKEYFEEMNRLDSIKIKYMFNSDGSIYNAIQKKSESHRIDSDNSSADNSNDSLKIALGVAAVVVSSAVLYGVCKFIKKH